MNVKQLKEILKTVNDDAEVVLYDGLDEGDVWCTEAVEIPRSQYDPYCQADSCLRDEDYNGKLFVLAGFGSSFGGKINKNLRYIVSTVP